MNALKVEGKKLVAILLLITCALFLRAWLQLELVSFGYALVFARNLSYLIVSPVTFLALAAICYNDRRSIAERFDLGKLNIHVVTIGLLAGILLRLLFWSVVVVRVSFGFDVGAPGSIVGPAFQFDCGPLQNVLLAFIATVVLVPLIEEIVHRLYVMSYLAHRGQWVAVVVSALLFMVFHRFSGWWFAFAAGIFFGFAYWFTRSLWIGLIGHMTVNALVILDWGCAKIQWNPQPVDLPLLGPGVVAVAVLVVSLTGLLLITRSLSREAANPSLGPTHL